MLSYMNQYSRMSKKKFKEISQASLKSHLSSIDMNIKKFEISCNAIFDEKKLTFVDEMFHFKEFKVHDYNVKVIKIVKKKAEKIKVGFEMNFFIAMISDIHIKSFFISIDDNIASI